jgi:flagellar motor switch protein FliG
MPVATDTTDYVEMTKLQKLAALLIILGQESASHLLRNLDEEELEEVSMEMARLTFVSQELQQDILEEFAEVAVAASAAILGGPSYAKSALERSVGPARASDILRRVSPGAVPTAALQPLLDMDCQDLINLLKGEQPQTLALIISYLPAEKISRFLVLLPPKARENVMMRLATMGASPVEVVERIASVLHQKTGTKPVRPLNQTGGVTTAAAVLNSLDRDVSQSVLVDLEKRNPKLHEEIRRKMFTFEDLVLLGPAALQKIVRQIDFDDLALALKTATFKLKTLLLSALTKRAGEEVLEKMAMLGPLQKREIEAAQARIVNAVRQLEGGGEINLNNLRNSLRNELLV